jgi:4-hydroxy-2-oxoheptanedioate aldolase
MATIASSAGAADHNTEDDLMTTATAFSLARRLKAGETVHSGWCGLSAPIVAELVAREGFPAVTLDSQHGLWDTASIVSGIAQVRQGGGAAIVRIPVGQFASASRALDFGAEGIIAPMINTEAEARAYVSFAKFPPIGERSWGPHRATTLASMSDQKVYLREANALTVTFAMIETKTALENVEAIAATPGIDALFLGPADLSIALSNGADVDPMSHEVDRGIDRMLAAARKAEKIMGAYCHSVERAVALAKRGVRFLAVGSDISFLRAGAAAALKAIKV